ncbi:Undecaprenyl-diphosphatase [Vibrio stylophorae]|uniref:Undecaprenyl-diphosphatase n=1 Tax=Vibrio stylophorae TaxID=659351 RepID=A0ABM8ZQX6_9VIBR|nr:undecaprenyl-diphosphate phosphatase [Vibrio stylophorae]CAH0532478.1 Undecaprenyl-diphosphatase [Vibrio stylophorae]
MSHVEAFILALIQGFTEFLPISSSAHLILPSEVLGWPDQGTAFDVAIHVGSLMAVMIYFRHEIVTLLSAWLKSIFKKESSRESHLAWMIIFSTIPACVFGLFIADFMDALRSSLVIATTTLIFGVLLWWVDVRATQKQDEYQTTAKQAWLIGLAQAAALIPGTSRSGATMTAALYLGFTREAAARFSFLMSIPIILLAGGYEAIALVQDPSLMDWNAMALGVATSFVSALICIHLFLGIISRMGMAPFAIYRVFLGIGLLVMVLG